MCILFYQLNMAKIRIKFRASSVEMKKGTLYFQVSHRHLTRLIHTTFKVFPDEWDNPTQQIIETAAVTPARRDELHALSTALANGLKHLTHIVKELDDKETRYTVDDVVRLYQQHKNRPGVIVFTRTLIAQLALAGRMRMAEKYTTTLNSFMRFLNGKDKDWEEVDSDLAQAYQCFLRHNNVCPNTISFYMRNLRAIYNHAVEKEYTPQRHPFRHVYTGIDKTVKRALSQTDIQRIQTLDLRREPQQAFARDIFMFSFYTRGMSFVDMAYLTPANLRNGVLTYRRKKTGQPLHIKWEAPMQTIVDRYTTGNTAFLLPLITRADKDPYRQYLNMCHKVNQHLKQVGQRLELPIPLTTYVARHSWASIARSKSIALSVISEALGHDSETTTQIYLASLDASAVDRANRQILAALNV